MRELNSQFEVTTTKGNTFFIDVRMLADYDANYGADADGNRGWSVHYIDDYWIESITSDNDIAPETEEMTEIHKKLEAFIENYDVAGNYNDDFFEEDYPEHD